MKAVFQILAPGRPEAATNCQARRRSADRCCRTRPRSPLESGKRQESIQHGWFLERLIVIGSQASNRVCRETCSVCRSRAELSASVASFTKERLRAQKRLRAQSLSCADHGRCAASEVARPVHRRAGSASGAHRIAGAPQRPTAAPSRHQPGARFKVVLADGRRLH
jgi:hypothetical protein